MCSRIRTRTRLRSLGLTTTCLPMSLVNCTGYSRRLYELCATQWLVYTLVLYHHISQNLGHLGLKCFLTTWITVSREIHGRYCRPHPSACMLRTHMLRLRPTHVFLTHIYTRRSPGPRRQYVYCTMRPFFSLFVCKFYFPAQLIGGFSLSDLLDKPWSQVTSHLPPGTCLQFLSRVWFNIPTARRSSSNVANSRSRAFR